LCMTLLILSVARELAVSANTGGATRQIAKVLLPRPTESVASLGFS
ncbi:MAG: hypothetical protein QOD35_1783, partial [Nocardioidaceae bacterium]|nr:hypothetical protein [Nocardioidaceae bacterium]